MKNEASRRSRRPWSRIYLIGLREAYSGRPWEVQWGTAKGRGAAGFPSGAGALSAK